MIIGYEHDFVDAGMQKAPVIKDYYDASIVVANWEVEMNAIVSALESIANDGVSDINKVEIDQVSANSIELVLKSEILSNFVVNIINDELKKNDLDEYYVVTEEQLDSVVDLCLEPLNCEFYCNGKRNTQTTEKPRYKQPCSKLEFLRNLRKNQLRDSWHLLHHQKPLSSRLL
jgi:hypothetical protein